MKHPELQNRKWYIRQQEESERSNARKKKIYVQGHSLINKEKYHKRIIRSTTFICKSDAITSQNLGKAPVLQRWVKAGYTFYNFVKLALLSHHLRMAVLCCFKKKKKDIVDPVLNLFLVDMAPLAIISKGQKKKKINTLNHKEDTNAKKYFGQVNRKKW